MSEHKYEVLAWNFNLFNAKCECIVNCVREYNSSSCFFCVFPYLAQWKCSSDWKWEIEKEHVCNECWGNISTEQNSVDNELEPIVLISIFQVRLRHHIYRGVNGIFTKHSIRMHVRTFFLFRKWMITNRTCSGNQTFLTRSNFPNELKKTFSQTRNGRDFTQS